MQINLSFGMDKYYSEKTYKMFEKYKIQTDNQKVYYANLGVIEVNMDKVMKIWYDKNEKKIELNKYLIMLGLDTKGKLKEMGNGDEIVEKYTDKLSELNNSGVFVRAITPEEDARLVANTEKYLIEEEALNKGLATGKRQSKLEIAKEMLKLNMNIAMISKITKLSIKEIKELEV